MILQMTRQEVAIGPHAIARQFFALPGLDPGASGAEQGECGHHAEVQQRSHGVFIGPFWGSWDESASNSMMSFTCCFLVLLLKNPVQIDLIRPSLSRTKVHGSEGSLK